MQKNLAPDGRPYPVTILRLPKMGKIRVYTTPSERSSGGKACRWPNPRRIAETRLTVATEGQRDLYAPHRYAKPKSKYAISAALTRLAYDLKHPCRGTDVPSHPAAETMAALVDRLLATPVMHATATV